MRKCLKEDKLINNGNPDIKIYYGEDNFLEDIELISNDIKYKYKDKKIGIIGIARGALPMLTTISHRLNIRRVDIAQIKMTNSDEKWDYGNPELLYNTVDDNIEEYIILEDIISHGRSVNLLVNDLIKKGKKVLAIYSLILNDEMKKYKLDNENMDIFYVNKINQQQWVNFMWENGYLDK